MSPNAHGSIAFIASVITSLYDIYCLAAATTVFTSKPANPSFVEEGQNITLVWSYILRFVHSVRARFSNVTSGSSELIGSMFSFGSIQVRSDYQDRFSGYVSNNQTQLTILTVQRSNHGMYEFELITFFDRLIHNVEVIVQCK